MRLEIEPESSAVSCRRIRMAVIYEVIQHDG